MLFLYILSFLIESNCEIQWEDTLCHKDFPKRPCTEHMFSLYGTFNGNFYYAK